MSERKVLTKYYPPDFDPSALGRQRKPKQSGPRVQTVRLMAPFSMRCLTCGEYIYKGRKFNARKETNQEEKYLGIQVFRFYIRCTRCSAEITFKTDPKNQDYMCERGAKRNTEPWRPAKEETDEERLDRIEKEEEERNAMQELEAKTVDAKREMAVADMLDEIRTSNARRDRTGREGGEMTLEMPPVDDELARQETEDADAAKRAFERARQAETEVIQEWDVDDAITTDMPPPPPPTTNPPKRVVKKIVGPKALGIKRKELAPEPEPASRQPAQKKQGLVDYGSDSD